MYRMQKETYICQPFSKYNLIQGKLYAKRPICMETDLHIWENRTQGDLYIWKETYIYWKALYADLYIRYIGKRPMYRMQKECSVF